MLTYVWHGQDDRRVSQTKDFICYQELLGKPTAKRLLLHPRLKGRTDPHPLQQWAISAPSILNIWTARSASNKAAFVPEPCSEKTNPWAPRSLQGKEQVSCSKAAQQGSNSGQHSQAAASGKPNLVRNPTQEPQTFTAAAKMSADRWGVQLKRFQLQDVCCGCGFPRASTLIQRLSVVLLSQMYKKKKKKDANHGFRFYVTMISSHQIFGRAVTSLLIK